MLVGITQTRVNTRADAGAKNFDPRNWIRRSFWREKPWQLGIGWRFVVGTTLPRGDNDRVSLHYEAHTHGDLVLLRGSELPPMQAYTPLLWWVHAAAKMAGRPGAPPFFGLSTDSVLIHLPRLAMRLQSLLLTRLQASVEPTERMIYGGELRWATWADRSSVPWRCVAAVLGDRAASRARLAGDVGPPSGALSAEERERVEALGAGSFARGPLCNGMAGAFMAAGPELQLISTPLLLRVAPLLRMGGQRLEVMPPRALWEGSKLYHQNPAGRTPSQPATLAAIALARVVHNATVSALGVAFLHLRAASRCPPFSWKDATDGKVPDARAVLVRGVNDSVKAEAVLAKMISQHAEAAAASRVRCSLRRCRRWGWPGGGRVEGACCGVESDESSD